MKQFKIIAAALLIATSTAACNDDETSLPAPTPTSETYAKGADISWVTEMEKAGVKFRNSYGAERDCFQLMKELGMDAIRLRVWVNPTNGWCNKEDVVAKAWRANQLGMRLMIDFHYSDWWADPGQQNKPAAWKSLSFEKLKEAVADHTKDVLNALKEKNITPEWVQVGNETGNGMMWEDGKASENMAQYAALNNAGYDAVKSVFATAKVIVHLQSGDNNSLFRWLFDGLKSNGGKWDVIGVSLYPGKETWQDMTQSCIHNMNDMVSRYNCEVMICEVGMPASEAATAKVFLSELIKQSKAMAENKCLGIFYWEPQGHQGWNNYLLGAFDDEGKPTEAMDAFK